MGLRYGRGLKRGEDAYQVQNESFAIRESSLPAVGGGAIGHSLDPTNNWFYLQSNAYTANRINFTPLQYFGRQIRLSECHMNIVNAGTANGTDAFHFGLYLFSSRGRDKMTLVSGSNAKFPVDQTGLRRVETDTNLAIKDNQQLFLASAFIRATADNTQPSIIIARNNIVLTPYWIYDMDSSVDSTGFTMPAQVKITDLTSSTEAFVVTCNYLSHELQEMLP